MIFEVRSILSFILSKNVDRKHIKYFSALPPVRLNSKQPHRLLPKRYINPSKLLVCLLCLNVLFVSTYHVICIELFNEEISKSHLQLYECKKPQNNEHGINLQHQNQKVSHIELADLLRTAPSCPECIDEHIQFAKFSTGIYLYNASPLKTFLPAIQNKTPRLFFAGENSSVPREHHFPLSSFHSSVIRSTVLLI